MTEAELIERLADLVHRQWSGWMEYMLRVWSPESLARWKRQMVTDYKDLSEKEKESDRVEARRMLKVVREAHDDH